MYLRDLWTSCVRRWYLVIVGLVIAGAALTLAAAEVPTTYESTASLVLVPPPNPETPKLNRYLDLGGLTDAVAVLSSSMTSDELQQQFADEVDGGSYEVGADTTTSAPIVAVTAKAPTKAGADQLLGLVLTRIPDNLAGLQKALSIGSSSQITAVKVSQDPPKRVDKTRLRILGALAVALLVAAAMFVALLDGLLLRRKEAKEAEVEEPRAPVVALERGDGRVKAVPRSRDDPEPMSEPEPGPETTTPTGSHEAVRSEAGPAGGQPTSRRRSSAKRVKRQSAARSSRSGASGK